MLLGGKKAALGWRIAPNSSIQQRSGRLNDIYFHRYPHHRCTHCSKAAVCRMRAWRCLIKPHLLRKGPGMPLFKPHLKPHLLREAHSQRALHQLRREARRHCTRCLITVQIRSWLPLSRPRMHSGSVGRQQRRGRRPRGIRCRLFPSTSLQQLRQSDHKLPRIPNYQ